MAELTAEWQGWLAENLERGCSSESMVEAMVSGGFDASYASALIQIYARSGPLRATPAAITTKQHGDYVYDAPPVAAGNTINVGDRKVTVAMRCERPQLLVLDDLLSAEECDEIIARSRSKLKRSTIVDPKTGREDVIEARTSEGTFFGLCEDEFITRIDRRIARLMNWPIENGEGLQILHYNVGGEYTPHFDYFPPTDPGSASHLRHGGQRVATLIVYLNDVAGGGATIFPEVQLSVTPRKGSAVYFRYCNAQGQLDPVTLHGGAPVTDGEKWIMTKWMRQRRHG